MASYTGFVAGLFGFVLLFPTASDAQTFKWQEGTAYETTAQLSLEVTDFLAAGPAPYDSVGIQNSDLALDSGFFESPALSAPGAEDKSFSGLRFRLPIASK